MASAASTRYQRLSLIASTETLERIGARPEDLGDPDVRTQAIRADHPELEQVLREGRSEIVLDGQPVNVRLHFAMHEAVAAQLADDDPVEVFQTAQRLRAAGYSRHEVLHMLAATIAEQIHAMLADGELYDRERHIAGLRGLPGAWERRRQQRTLERSDPQGRHSRRGRSRR
jgi:hypothetical protein